METMQKRVIKKGNLIYTISRVFDTDADLSYLEQDYSDCTPEEQDTYRQQDQDRLEAYNRDDWHMLGVLVEIAIETATRWAIPHTVARASLWGIESDSEESYIASVEEEMIAEAEADLARTREALSVCSAAAEVVV